MESISTTIQDNFLTCTICLEVYKEPQLFLAYTPSAKNVFTTLSKRAVPSKILAIVLYAEERFG